MAGPLELSLEIEPGSRFDVIDVRGLARDATPRSTPKYARDIGGALRRYPHALYCSFHTTAGYLEQSLASRLSQASLGIGPYMHVFRALFPEGAGYRHDDLGQRRELTPDQRGVEPRNADAHLAFIAAGLRTCVKYVNRPSEPVYFVDLDGMNGERPRRRRTSIIAFNQEEVVARDHLPVPVSSHPLDSVNLKERRVGLYDCLQDLIARHEITKGRVRLSLAAGEHQAGLTINEYETLLMRHDLIEVLRDPLRFVAEKGRHLLHDPWAIPGKTIDYAKYDLVRLFNQVCDAFHMSESLMERLLARLIEVPARRFLGMKRSVSLLVSDRVTPGQGAIAEGTYQCPILVQWRKAPTRQRWLDVTLSRLD